MAERTNVPEIRFAGFTDPWEQRKLGEVALFPDERMREWPIAALTLMKGDEGIHCFKLLRYRPLFRDFWAPNRHLEKRCIGD